MTEIFIAKSNDVFLKLDYRVGLKQVTHEIDKEIERMFWDKWLTLYPNMNQDNFISFSEFKEMHKPQERLNESDKERIDRLVDNIRGKGGE